MKKKFYLMMILVLSASTILATNPLLLKGRVIDANTKDGLEYVTVSIHKLDSSVVAGSISDENGNFSINNIPLGKYYLQSSLIGYREVRLDLNIATDVLEIPLIEMKEISRSSKCSSTKREASTYRAKI